VVIRRYTGLPFVLASLGMLVVVAAVHAPTLNDYFGGDDFMVLGPVRALGPWELVWKSFLARDNIPYWRPLVSPLYAFEVHVFWLRPLPYHAVVIGLHLINVGLLALVAWSLTGRRRVALAAALIFGINPAHATTVPMISSTVELFSFIWYLSAVACCLQFIRTGSVRWYWAGLFAFVLGLLSKESVASAAGVITVLFFLLDRRADLPPRPPSLKGREGGRGGRFVLRIAPFWLLVAPYTVLTFVTDTDDPTGITRVMYSPGLHVGQNMWWFLARLAAPLENGHGPTVNLAGHAGAALLLGAAVLALVRGSNQVRFLVVWTAIALTPLALWLPELLLGRFTYMASAPFAILLALAGAWAVARVENVVPRALPRWAPAAVLVGAAIVGLGLLTVEQNRERTREGETYRILVSALRRDYPNLPDGSAIVLEDGVWPGPFHAIFLNSVADTLYGPGRVQIRNAGPDDAVTGAALRLRYDHGSLVAVDVPPSGTD
jgi:hypothetical protein